MELSIFTVWQYCTLELAVQNSTKNNFYTMLLEIQNTHKHSSCHVIVLFSIPHFPSLLSHSLQIHPWGSPKRQNCGRSSLKPSPRHIHHPAPRLCFIFNKQLYTHPNWWCIPCPSYYKTKECELGVHQPVADMLKVIVVNSTGWSWRYTMTVPDNNPCQCAVSVQQCEGSCSDWWQLRGAHWQYQSGATAVPVFIQRG